MPHQLFHTLLRHEIQHLVNTFRTVNPTVWYFTITCPHKEAVGRWYWILAFVLTRLTLKPYTLFLGMSEVGFDIVSGANLTLPTALPSAYPSQRDYINFT